MSEDITKKAAFVAVVGRPSVGKSTLVNKLCGEKVAIVSTVPQTTRNAIRGIVNREQGQLVFVDTPGRHKSEKKFNKKLTEVSGRAVTDSDIVLYVLDAARAPGPEEADIAEFLIPHVGKTVIAINKIDADGADAGRIRNFLGENLPGLGENRLFTISALNGEGVEELLSALYDMSPEGEPLYGEEYYTDQDVNFRIAEIIREQAINRLREELPHALYVDIADAQFTDPQKLWVRAFIFVERDSQKGMVVGKGGTMIRDIRLAALKELRKIFDWKIELDLRVKTGKDWRHNDRVLNKLVK
jgi:GTP-binding protein Era